MDGSNRKVLAKLDNSSFDELIVNGTGIYLFRQSSTSGLNMIRFDLNGKIVEKIRLKGHISDVYIYDDNIYYVQKKNNRSLVMLYQVSMKQEMCYYDQAQRIAHLCGNNKYIFFQAFYGGKKGMEDGWMMHNRPDCQISPINIKDPIIQIDFVRRIFWMEKTIGGEKYWVAGSMSRNAHGWETMPRWKVPADLDSLLSGTSSGRIYFDGEHLYVARSESAFEAYDPSGRSSGRWNMQPHGDVRHFQVMDQMLMINSSGYTVDFYPLSFEPCDPIRDGWFCLGGFDGDELIKLKSENEL